MINKLKTLAVLLTFSYGLMLYLALLQTIPGQPLQFHADAPVWLTLQAAIALWLSRNIDSLLWATRKPTSLLTRYGQSFSLSLILFVCIMTLLQFLIDLAVHRPDLWQQYLRISLTYVLVHSLIAGFDLLWLGLKNQQYQQLELLKIEQQQQHYKLKLLQQQLDPHFLFNNLNVLSVLIHKNAVQAEQFLEQFADIYRYQLQHGGKSLVTLTEELKFAYHYLALLQQRFPNSFHLHNTVDPVEAAQLQLIPCSLQLLLENVVKHNQASANKPLVIVIEVQPAQLVVRHVLRPKSFAQPGTGTGLANLTERCQVLLGCPLEILQNEQFIVRVPLRSRPTESYCD